MSHIEIIVENGAKSGKNAFKNNKITSVKTEANPKIQFKGITLKEYFRLCDQSKQMEQIEEESVRSSEESKVNTPAFGCNENQPLNQVRKQKMKTEIEEHKEIETIYNNKNIKKNKNIFYPMMGQKFSNTMDQKLQQGLQFENLKKIEKNYPIQRKRVVSIPSESSKDFLNQSTLSSFYQLEKKKKKMLNKLKIQKERANEMRLSDAFFITKYGSKFNLDHKKIQ